MLNPLKMLETFLYTLLLTPAVALAQEVNYVGDPVRRGWGWGWIWLVVAIIAVIALASWAVGQKRGRRVY
jgi:ABC-type multidrug transport system permease subunit